MTETQVQAEYDRQIVNKLLAAIFRRFSEYLPPLGWFRERYSSGEIFERLQEYFDGEDLTALKSFAKRFIRRRLVPPRKVDECTALVLAGAEIDRLERYEFARMDTAGARNAEFVRDQPIKRNLSQH